MWKQCDGKTSVTEIAVRLSARFEADADDEVVWSALEDLWKRQLLVGEPAPVREGTMSRSQVLRRAGVAAAVAVPVVISIAAPKARARRNLHPVRTTVHYRTDVLPEHTVPADRDLPVATG